MPSFSSRLRVSQSAPAGGKPRLFDRAISLKYGIETSHRSLTPFMAGFTVNEEGSVDGGEDGIMGALNTDIACSK